MKIHEYQSKAIFKKYEIPVPKGFVANSAREVKNIAEELGGKVVIKAQVLIGGRGRAGGIRLVNSSEEAEEQASKIFSLDIKGLPVHRVLVDEAANIHQEIYLGITNDRKRKQPVIIACQSGGMAIEDIAREYPELIHQISVDPMIGLQDYQARSLAISIDLDKKLWKKFISISEKIWKIFIDHDATLVEINPLVITEDFQLLALDGKITLDENALYRHSELAELRDLDVESFSDIEARKNCLSYAYLGGDIGCMVNGAGLAMATMDILKQCGGEPANFLDIGGGASREKVAAGMKIILLDKRIRCILINIFGGITRCDEVAKGILYAIEQIQPVIPIVVRLVGTRFEEARSILSETNLIMEDTLVNAAKTAVTMASGESR